MNQLSIAALKAARAGKLIGRRVVYLAQAASTNEVAKGLARRRAAEGTVVLADEQTAGKGRLGRAWTSPPGASILLSVILRPTASQLPKLTMMAALATARAVETATGLSTRLKWPNDVMMGGKKAGGILLEAEITGERPTFAVVGIGLNVNFDVRTAPEIPETATSISLELGHDFPRQELLLALLEELESAYLALKAGGPIREEWRARLETLGRRVRVARMMGPPEEGVAEDVDEQGQLLLRRADGSLLALSEGDVSLR
ncbi:MAG: biotin--[acetyl-CoA-carboxylase] ligase [Dehalococcoidia bacterium]|nr:biotin--[acetyl-CoA-carboxylase] ligase [Dehalococcoidia bacterium]